MNQETEEEFCVVDLWAAEAYIVALFAGEATLKGMLDRGEKIHDYVLEQTKKKFPSEVEKAGYNYKLAKQTVHGCNYNVQVKKMEQSSHLPAYVCEWQFAWYHSTFPGIKRRMRAIEEQIKFTSSLTNAFGRQKVFLCPYGQEMLNQAYAWPAQSTIGELALIALHKLHLIGRLVSSLETLNRSDLNGGRAWVFPSLNTHDGMAVRCKKGNRPAVRKSMIDAFDIPIKLGDLQIKVPIELQWGANFQDLEDTEIHRYT